MDNLNHISVDYDKAISFLKYITINKKKYLKNLDRIKRINIHHIALIIVWGQL